jgi:release factor glutamine methyltransferase
MSAARTVAGCLDAATRRLRRAGVAAPRLDAGLLLGHVLGADRAVLIGHPDRQLDPGEDRCFSALIGRRAAREPIAQLTGEREFWSLSIAVGPAVLAPRPDSETLIEAALEALADRGRAWRVLDLGTGSGCLLLAALCELPNAIGIGVDISWDALAVARRNATRLGLADRARFAGGFWGRALVGDFDLIVANPPYIADAAFADLEPEVARYEPRIALAGGADGLDCYRGLAADLKRLLAPSGIAAVEIGAGQSEAVSAILAEAGVAVTTIKQDLSGIERCLVVRGATEN